MTKPEDFPESLSGSDSTPPAQNDQKRTPTTLGMFDKATYGDIRALMAPPESHNFDRIAEQFPVLDLPAAVEDAVETHERWGLAGALRKAGIVGEGQYDYRDYLRSATLTLNPLEIPSSINLDRDHLRIILDPGHISLDELVDILFRKAGFPIQSSFQSLDQFRMVEPISRDLSYFMTLAKKPFIDGLAAFQNLYKNAAPLVPSHHPRIILTPQAIGDRRTSANEDLIHLADGRIRLVDPFADFLSFREEIDQWDMRHRGTATRYSNCLNSLGKFLTLSISLEGGFSISLQETSHGHKDGRIASRLAFGKS